MWRGFKLRIQFSFIVTQLFKSSISCKLCFSRNLSISSTLFNVLIGPMVIVSLSLFYLLLFFGHTAACGILVPQPWVDWIEPRPLTVRVLSPNHWTAREFLLFHSWCWQYVGVFLLFLLINITRGLSTVLIFSKN